MTKSSSVSAEDSSGGAKIEQRMINVILLTADQCEGHFSVMLAADGKLAQSRITWSPNEPDKQTESVIVTVGFGDHEEGQVMDGETWRELESRELDDQLWARVLSGDSLEDAFESMPISSSRPRM